MSVKLYFEVTWFKFIWVLPIFVSTIHALAINTCEPNYDKYWQAPHPDDCTKFVECELGTAISEDSCSNGWIFDYKKRACFSNGECFPGEGVEFTCQGQPDYTRLPDTRNCRQFQECVNNQEIPYECPEDKPFFDYTTSACTEESMGFCYPGSIKDIANDTYSSTTQDPTITTNMPTPGINTCLPNLDYSDYLPHPSNCSLRVRCQNGQPVDESPCPNATWKFDYVFLSCVGGGNADCYPGDTISCATHSTSDRQYIPHPKYCRQYYDCTYLTGNEQGSGRACQEPTPFFDYRTMMCVTADSVLCYPGTSLDVPPPCS